MRSKLQHVIIDEYQDLSVAQHRLVSLLLKGESNSIDSMEDTKLPPILLDDNTFPTSAQIHKQHHILFTTPKLFAAGDPNQSIYGWRAASPITTVEGFRRDYPQGIVVPLNTHFRSPQTLLATAKSLFKSKVNVESSTPMGFQVSPAAIQSLKGMLRKSEASVTLKDEVIKKLLDSDASGQIIIKGLWDEREESKYILSRIRRRWKERADCVLNTLGYLHKRNTTSSDQGTFYDESDIAIMVRTSNQLAVLTEELRRSNVPFILDPNDPKQIVPKAKQSMLPMKPVKVMTMHRAKGDEFDDVYLLGWNEGVFPHPASVRSNRVEEERRLAYVALSRARQRCVITYSFVQRNRYTGPR